LAKIIGGFSDNLLTSVVRAWDTMGLLGDMSEALPQGKKRIVVALAMNTVGTRGECFSF
jgi:phosphopantothenoylcysteine decarboxylase